MKKIILVLISIILICSIFSSCQKENNKNDNIQNKETINIGVLIYRYDDAFIEEVRNEISNYSNEINIESEFILNVEILDASNQQEIQIEQLENFIDRKFDVICINIVNRKAASDMIDMAKKADIPIVFFNREPSTLDILRWDKVFYVGCDAKQSGLLQGEMVIDYWNNNDIDKNNDGIMQCVILNGEENHQDTILRTENNIKAFSDNELSIEILASYTANWQRDQAENKIIACLEVFENNVEVIISNNDEMALGAVEAIKQTIFYSEDYIIPTFGIDATQYAIESMKRNELTGTVLNDGISQARGVVDIALALALKEDLSENEKLDKGRYFWVDYKKINRADID